MPRPRRHPPADPSASGPAEASYVRAEAARMVARWDRSPGTWATVHAAFTARFGSAALPILGEAFRAARCQFLLGEELPTPERHHHQ